MKVVRWSVPESRPPKRPYRDTLVFNLVLAMIVVGVAWATGGRLERAVVFAVLFFVAATGYSWWRWRQRLLEDERRRERALEPRPKAAPPTSR